MRREDRNSTPSRCLIGKAPLALLLSLAILSLSQSAYAVDDISEADELLIKGKYKQAEEAYRSMIEGDETGDAYAGLAVSLAKQNLPNKILEAEKVLRQAKDKFSDNPNVMASGGLVSFVHSRTVASPAKRDLYLEASETLCRRAIKASPDTVIAHTTLGQVKLAQDDAEGAIGPFRRALELAENPPNLTFLARALLKVDPKDKEAEELVDKALALKKDYYPAHLEKAIVLLNQGKNEDAFLQLKYVPRLEREGQWFLVEGDVYRKQGDGPSALASWRESIRLDPHNPDGYKHLAEYYALRGDGELAIAEMHNALEILPNDMALRNELAELALRQDKLDVAETEFRTILASAPEDPRALLGLSRVYFRKARKEGQYPPGWQQLMDQLQNVVTEHSVRAQMIKSGARSLQENIQLSEASKALSQKQFREARQLYTQVINSHRDDPYDLLTLGEQAYNDGDLRSAETAYTYAREIPEIASRAEQGMSKIATQRNEAARQTKLGDATWRIPEVAIDHYNQALIHDPQYPNAYYGLFALHTKSVKESDKALDYGANFLEAADDGNPLRKEVESTIAKLKKQAPDKKSSK